MQNQLRPKSPRWLPLILIINLLTRSHKRKRERGGGLIFPPQQGSSYEKVQRERRSRNEFFFLAPPMWRRALTLDASCNILDRENTFKEAWGPSVGSSGAWRSRQAVTSFGAFCLPAWKKIFFQTFFVVWSSADAEVWQQPWQQPNRRPALLQCEEKEIIYKWVLTTTPAHTDYIHTGEIPSSARSIL